MDNLCRSVPIKRIWKFLGPKVSTETGENVWGITRYEHHEFPHSMIEEIKKENVFLVRVLEISNYPHAPELLQLIIDNLDSITTAHSRYAILSHLLDVPSLTDNQKMFLALKYGTQS